MNRILYVTGLCALALPLWASENIVLRTGFRLAADRHEVDGGTIRIFSGDGVTEIPVSLVATVERVEVERVEAEQVEAAQPEQAPAAVLIAAPQAVRAPEAGKPDPTALTPADLAATAARKYSLPSAFVASVMRAESGFNATAISPKGAIGLMQLMPDTARDLGVDPAKPAENADAGTRYLRDLLERYEDSPNQVVLALAAYNAGPAAVEKYHGVPPYRETREYIWRVLKTWNPAGLNDNAAPDPAK